MARRPRPTSGWSRRRYASKGEYRPDSIAVAAVRYWAGYTDYKHDEIGLNAIGFEQINATFKNHAMEGKAEVEIDTDVDADRLPHRHRRGAVRAFGRSTPTATPAACSARREHRAQPRYFFNVLQLTDTWRTLLAGRIESNRLDGASGDFPANFLPPPDMVPLTPRSLGFVPKSISFSVIKDLPSYLVASANVAAHPALADRARAVRPWRARCARHLRDRQCRT